jgi:hypothetical protein
MSDLNKIHARIEIEVELGELSASGTMLDLRGLSRSVQRHLESLPMNGPQMRVVSVAPATKMWEIEAQLRANVSFDNPTVQEIPQ